MSVGGSSGTCTPGAQQCSGSTPQTCDENGVWQSAPPCQFVCSAGACTGTCVPNATQCNGLVPQTCDAAGNWQDGTACQFACTAGSCSGSCTPGEKKCKLTTPQLCGADGNWQNGTACPYGCEAGACKELCKAGEFHCEGAQVMQCDAGPPAKWVPKSPALTCTVNQACDEATGTCKTLSPLGSSTPTGTYYQYATFTSANTGGVFKNGYDVDSYENNIYVNRSSYLDHYQVTLQDTDGDGKLEPDQHPNNPLSTGPIEKRVLTLVKSYAKAAPDNAPIGSGSISELFALSDRIFSLGPTHDGSITQYLFNTKVTTVVVKPKAAYGISQMGFGDLDGKWYGSNEGARKVYSFHAPSQTWVAEFMYPDLAGSHMDGMEVIVSPSTGEQYVFVSDMTSDYIGQYRKDPTGWKQVNLFKYADTTTSSVEGFGFGALNHFWATGGSTLYELGGGDLAKYLE